MTALKHLSAIPKKSRTHRLRGLVLAASAAMAFPSGGAAQTVKHPTINKPVPAKPSIPVTRPAPSTRPVPGSVSMPAPNTRPVPGNVSRPAPSPRPLSSGTPVTKPVSAPLPNTREGIGNRPTPTSTTPNLARAPQPMPGRVSHQYNVPGGGVMQTSHDRNGNRSVQVARPGGVVQTQQVFHGGPRVVQTVRPTLGGGQEVVTSYGRNQVTVVRSVYGHSDLERHSTMLGDHSSAVIYRRLTYQNVVFTRPVPAYIYQPTFYNWSWGTPVAYGWGWNTQPWYGAYGSVFTPYPTYSSLNLWMTDYVIASNLQRAYAANQPSQGGNTGPVPDQSAPTNVEASTAPPQITPQMKEQIAEEVRLDLQEQQQAAAQGPSGVVGPVATGAGADAPLPEDTPDALKAGHTLFRVVTPISVEANGQTCNLNADDYITRTSGMDKDTGLVTVTVTASRTVDCPQGASTAVALNDLMVMQSAQQERVMEGLQVASANVGKNGLPAGANPGATAVPLGQAVPDAGLAATGQKQRMDADQDLKQAAALGGPGL